MRASRWRFTCAFTLGPQVALLTLLSLLLGPARAQAQTRRGLVAAVFPPVVKGGDGEQLALLIAAHAVEYLVESGGYADLHVKQILRMAERERRARDSFAVPDTAIAAAERLGADRTAFGELRFENGVWELSITAARVERPIAAPQPTTQPLPQDTLEAVRTGGRLMAELVAKLDGVSLPATVLGVTNVRSSEALRDYGECYALLVDQSLRIDSPGLLSSADLIKAERSCEKAVKADGDFVSARAALGLTSALMAAGFGDAVAGRRALESLQHVPAEHGYQPLFWMATYWLAARFSSPEEGERVLRAALKKYPSSLILHAYLGRHLIQMEQYTDARSEWEEYLRLSPRSAYVMDRLSYAMARLPGMQGEAIVMADRAWSMDRTNHEAQLELASRFIDSKRWQDAITLLEQLVRPEAGKHLPAVRGEILLRLGYAYLNRQPPDLTLAQQYLEQAREVADQPSEWKTRARAELNLALLYEKQGKTAEAKRELGAARGPEGSSRYVDRYVSHSELLAELDASLQNSVVPAAAPRRRMATATAPATASATATTTGAPGRAGSAPRALQPLALGAVAVSAKSADTCVNFPGICVDFPLLPKPGEDRPATGVGSALPDNRYQRLLDSLPSQQNNYRSPL